MPAVCHISTVHHGSDPRIVHKQAGLLAFHGFEVTVVAKPALGREHPEGVTVATFCGMSSRLRRMFLGPVEVIRFLRSTRPQLVHLHDPELLPLVPLIKRFGCAVVYDVHEDLAAQIRSKPWIVSALRNSVAWLAGILEPRLVGNADGVVVVDGAWADRFRPGDVVTLANLPLRRTTHAALPMSERAPVFAYVGGIDHLRGVQTMVEAAAMLDQHPGMDPSAKIKLGGPIRPESLRVEMMSGRRRIETLGWLDRSEITTLLDEALCGLLFLAPIPNYANAVATKLYEYLQAGLPVIASDTPAHRQLIERWDCGLLVPYDDPAAAASAMVRLHEDRALAERLGKNAVAAWQSMVDFDSQFDEVLALYRRLGVDAPSFAS